MNPYQDTAEESLKWTWKIKPTTNMSYQIEIEGEIVIGGNPTTR